MGLMDILNGMQHGPRGAQKPSAPGQSGGMSPIMLALLGLLAYKALKGSAPSGTPASAPPSPPPSGDTGGSLGDILGGLLGASGRPSGSPTGASGSNILGGLLGDLLGGAAGPASGPSSAPAGGNISDVLGGLLGGGAAGSVLNNGLGNVLRDLQNAGRGDTAKSWVSTGANEQIAPDDLAHALGADAISTLTRQTGLSRDELLTGLAQHLPNLVDQLTPEGRLPTEEEAKQW